MTWGGGRSVPAALAVALAVFVSGAPAQAADDVPDSGFGSRVDPMSLHQGSGGLYNPSFRFFNPCARHTSRAIFAYVERLDSWTTRLTWPGQTPVVRAMLKCEVGTLRALGGGAANMTCVTAAGRRIPSVRGSAGFTHGFGPIIQATLPQDRNDDLGGGWDPMEWQEFEKASLFNWGWVSARIDYWYLCPDGS